MGARVFQALCDSSSCCGQSAAEGIAGRVIRVEDRRESSMINFSRLDQNTKSIGLTISQFCWWYQIGGQLMSSLWLGEEYNLSSPPLYS